MAVLSMSMSDSVIWQRTDPGSEFGPVILLGGIVARRVKMNEAKGNSKSSKRTNSVGDVTKAET